MRQNMEIITYLINIFLKQKLNILLEDKTSCKYRFSVLYYICIMSSYALL